MRFRKLLAQLIAALALFIAFQPTANAKYFFNF